MKKTSLNARKLAQEFDVSIAVMSEFLDRFSPSHVAADRFVAEADTMLFIHIPKTAGVSVGRGLHGAFDEFRGVKWNDVSRSFREATRQAVYEQTYLKKRQVIMGHFGWPEMRLWRNHQMPMKCGTIFRAPVARAISNYNYNCSDAHPNNASFRENFPTLATYIEQMPLDAQLTQAVGFINTFENALEKLLAHYTFLGTTEHLSASLAHLARSHGLRALGEYRENVGAPREDDEIPGELRDQIEARSHNDRKLHLLLSRIYEAAPPVDQNSRTNDA